MCSRMVSTFFIDLLVCVRMSVNVKECESVGTWACGCGCVHVCRPMHGLLLSETMLFYFVFCSGRRTACSVKSRTRHKETTTAGATGEDSNINALF